MRLVVPNPDTSLPLWTKTDCKRRDANREKRHWSTYYAWVEVIYCIQIWDLGKMLLSPLRWFHSNLHCVRLLNQKWVSGVWILSVWDHFTALRSETGALDAAGRRLPCFWMREELAQGSGVRHCDRHLDREWRGLRVCVCVGCRIITMLQVKDKEICQISYRRCCRHFPLVVKVKGKVSYYTYMHWLISSVV